MIGLLLVLATATPPGTFEVEQAGLRIRVYVRAAMYVYEVTNFGTEPITRIEIPCGRAYNYKVPPEWELDAEGAVLRAWTTNPRRAIHPGQKAELSFRMTSGSTCILGAVDLRAKSASGQWATVPDVWGPVFPQRGGILLIPGLVLAIFVFHSLLLARSNRRRRRSAMAG
jgi:hypothetical protein